MGHVQLNSFTKFAASLSVHVILDQSLDDSAKFNKICINYNFLLFSNLCNYN